MASSFSTLRQRGYGTLYAIKVEGIPFIFTEGPPPYRVDAESVPAVPDAGYTASDSFMVVNDTTIDQELDRESSVSRGKALSIVLSWDVLTAEGILDDLFRRPAYHTTITADVSATATTIAVADTTDFGSVSHAGQFYLGRELIKYTGTTSTSFTGCTRGYLGYKYKFRKDDPGSHGIISPTPHAWMGRFVTIYEHLLSPEGRILDDTWCEGSYQRELWKGYISRPPVPGKLGMTLEALPLMRMAAQDLGSSLQGTTVGYKGVAQSQQAIYDYPIYVSENSTLSLSGFGLDGTTDESTKAFPTVESGADYSDWPKIPPGIHRLGTWGAAVADSIYDALVGTFAAIDSVTFQVHMPAEGEEGVFLGWSIRQEKNGADKVLVKVQMSTSNTAYWMWMWPSDGISWIATEWPEDDWFLRVKAQFNIEETPWLVTRNIEGQAALDFTLEDEGLAVVKAGDTSEVIRWDTAPVSVDAYGTALDNYTVVYMAQRMVGADSTSIEQLPAELDKDGTFEVVAGAVGTLDTVASTMLESSGTGERGDNDTLPLGFGLGIPEEWIDLDATGGAPITNANLPLLAMGRTSFAEVFAGWYQLASECLCLRRNSLNVLQFQRATVVPAKVISTGGPGFMGTLLTKSDVVVGGTSVPRLVVAPNQISIDTTAGPYESAQFTYNAVGRIQDEGVHAMSLNVPGGRSEILSASVLSIMSRGLGQSIIRFDVAPWIDIQVGDPVSITVGHPLLFDWSDGTRMPANVAGRVVGWSFNMKTGEQSLTILLDGLLETSLYLCPVSIVTNVSGNDITISTGGGKWFRDGEKARFYNRGNEAAEYTELTITSIATDVLTLSSSPPAWLTSANATRVTYPIYTAASSDQTAAFMYVRSDKYWR